ncbi:MAG: ATP synthase F1 subunit epsilon [Acidimicrobiia bacterium]
MNPTFPVIIVSPEQVLYEGEGEMVVCRTVEGEIAFMPGHQPLLGALGTAKVRVIQPDGEQTAAVHEGFVEVTGDRVVVLSDVAELPDQIDVSRAQAAKERAEAALRSDPENEESKAALARADLRLEVAGAVPG